MTIALSFPFDQPSKFSRIPWRLHGVRERSRPVPVGTLAASAVDSAPTAVAPSVVSAKRSEP